MLLSNTKIKILKGNLQQVKILILLSISLVSCNFNQNYILIKDINLEKSEKIVRVKGTVEKTVPLIRSSSYKIQDDTGSVWVVTSGSLPMLETEIRIEAKVQIQNIVIGDEELNKLYLIELQKLPDLSKLE